jgi:hypothetical protein
VRHRPPDRERLLDHLEAGLGGDRWMTYEADREIPFTIFAAPDRPADGVTTTFSFGISQHVLAGQDGSDRSQELLISLRRDLDDAALQIVANIGVYILDRHVALLEGETIRLPAPAEAIGLPARDEPRLDWLVAAPPVPFAPSFATFAEASPPIELVWLLPFAEIEHHVVVEHGWRDLLRWLEEKELDPYDLRRAAVV